MLTKTLSLFAVLALLVAAAPVTSHAGDLCLQFQGASCDLSGDLGFFRFTGAKLPKNIKKASALHGRVAGVGTATGTAAMVTDGSFIDVSATFFVDADEGQIQASIDPANLAATHSGRAAYGTYGLGGVCDVTIVDCAGEPGLP